jgi:hypothetical protein
MPKRSSKDENQIAADILRHLTGEPEKAADKPAKNPAAVALGRMGGLKGGKARAKSLSRAKRVQIAKKAAQSRWGKS